MYISHLARYLLLLLPFTLLAGCDTEILSNPQSTETVVEQNELIAEIGSDAPLMREIEEMADLYDVPVDLLVVLGQLGSAYEDRGDRANRDGGYGIMALRDNQWGGDSLQLATELTGIDTETLKVDPAANIMGTAAVLDLYAMESGLDREDINAWLPAVIRFAALGDDASDFFAREVYERLQNGFSLSNSSGETFAVAPRLITVDLNALIPEGIRPVSPEELADLPVGKDRKLLAGQTDYPGAIWDPAASCNYSSSTSSKDTVIVHTIEGSAASALSWFKNCAAYSSAHYVVSESGTVWQMVREANIAWHVLCYNGRSVGIEHEGYAASPSHPQSLYDASALLARDICNRWGIPKEKRTVGPGILGHVDVTNCCCGTHTDPGTGWDWTYYINKINGAPLAAGYYNQSYPATMEAGSTAVAWVEFRNNGTETWQQGQVRLGTSEPQDRSSPFYTAGNWIADNRPTEMDQTSCASGNVARFSFILTAPETTGTYREHYRLLKEYVAWFGDIVWFEIQVQPRPAYRAEYVSNTFPTQVTAGETYNLSVTYTNTGNNTWDTTNTRLGTSNPRDRDSVFVHSSWLGTGQDRPTAVDSATATNQNGTFTFTVQAPTTTGQYSEHFELVQEGVAWFSDTGDDVVWNVEVVAPSSSEKLDNGNMEGGWWDTGWGGGSVLPNDWDGWYNPGDFNCYQNTSIKHGGSNSARTTIASGGDSGSGGYKRTIYQNVYVGPNAGFTFTAWAYHTNGNCPSIMCWNDGQDNNNPQNAYSAGQYQWITTDNWGQVNNWVSRSMTGTAPSSGWITIMVGGAHHGGGGVGTVYVDDCSVTVP